VAAGFYRFVKFFDYEQVNPGQDSAGDDDVEKIQVVGTDLSVAHAE